MGDENACAAAAWALGYAFMGNVSSRSYPRGCFIYMGQGPSNVQFNRHPVGLGRTRLQWGVPICTVAEPAPLLMATADGAIRKAYIQGVIVLMPIIIAMLRSP